MSHRVEVSPEGWGENSVNETDESEEDRGCCLVSVDSSGRIMVADGV